MGRQHVTYMLRIYGGEGGAEGTRIVMKGKTTDESANAMDRRRHVDANDIGELHATHGQEGLLYESFARTFRTLLYGSPSAGPA